MTRRIVAIRLEGGQGHEHISRYWWVELGGGQGDSSRPDMVAWVENSWNKAYVEDLYGRQAEVKVRVSINGNKYLQTRGDGIWSNNLLALPQK